MRKRKVSKYDFEISNLPSTRKEQFKDIYKINFWLLTRIGFTLLLFALPLMFCDYMKTIYLTSLQNELASDDGYKVSMLLASNFVDLIIIICLIILSLGLAGVSKIYKELAWGDGIFYFGDFIKGIKQNAKGFIKIALFLGICNSISHVFEIYISNSIGNALIVGLMFVIIIPITIMMFTIDNFYSNTFSNTLKNASLLTMKSYPIILLFSLFFPLIAVLNFFASSVPVLVLFLIILVLFIIAVPTWLLGWHLYELSNFDKFINENNFKDYYKKGLYLGDSDATNINQ